MSISSRRRNRQQPNCNDFIMNSDSVRYVLHCLLAKKHIPIYVTSAELEVKVEKYPALVVRNTDRSWERGSHWIGFILHSESSWEWFDSFGNSLSTYRHVTMPRGELKQENCKSLQSSVSYLCGEYVIMYFFNRFNGVTYKTFLSKFSTNTCRNDYIVRQFIASIPRIHLHHLYSNPRNQQGCKCRRLCPISFDNNYNKLKKAL